MDGRVTAFSHCNLLKEEIPVGHDFHIFPIRRLAQQFCLDERAWMRQSVGAEESGGKAVFYTLILVQRVVVDNEVEGDDVAIALSGALSGSLQGKRQAFFIIEMVAGVEEEAILSFGVAHAFVHCVVHALVSLAAPIGEAVGAALYVLLAPVGGAAVDYDPFPILRRLPRHALKRARQSFEVVQVYGDDG